MSGVPGARDTEGREGEPERKTTGAWLQAGGARAELPDVCRAGAAAAPGHIAPMEERLGLLACCTAVWMVTGNAGGAAGTEVMPARMVGEALRLASSDCRCGTERRSAWLAVRFASPAGGITAAVTAGGAQNCTEPPNGATSASGPTRLPRPVCLRV
mmetsp:Transcript_107419/g.333825  ORF Transcript_107419/g.333825 Transcript_107419/m.333825 type:complete len:157 (+) Transcript_107419:359-829(+)